MVCGRAWRWPQVLVRDLANKADVFLTNLLPTRLAKYGLDHPSLSDRNPRLVYASVSGWGLAGPNKDALAFDMTAFFARGGVMSVRDPPQAGCGTRSGTPAAPRLAQ